MEEDNLRRRLERAKKRIAIRQEQNADRLRDLAGSYWDRMTESKRSAAAFLRHPEKNVRLAALHVLSLYWERNPTDDCTAIIKDMALNDSERVVRVGAIVVLGDFCRDTSDPSVGQLFAETIIDDGQPALLRKAAYAALCSLCGKTDLRFVESAGEPLRLFRFPEDVNWTFVNRFLSPDVQQ